MARKNTASDSKGCVISRTISLEPKQSCYSCGCVYQNHPRDHTKYGALTPLELCRDGHHFKIQLFVHNINLRNVRKTKIRFVRPHVVRQWFCRGIFSMFVPRFDWSRLDGLLFWGGVGCLACLVLYLVQAPFMSIFVHDLLSSPKLFIQNGTIRKNWNGSFYFLVCSLYTLYTLNGICIDFIHIFYPFFSANI